MPDATIPPQRYAALAVDNLAYKAAFVLLALACLIMAAALTIDHLRRPAPAPNPPAVVDPTRPPVRPQPIPQPRPRPQPQPQPSAPDSPLTAAVRDYRDTLAQSLADHEAQLRARKFKTKADAVAYAKKHAAALAAAMDQAYSVGVDPQGNITDPDAIADQIGETARALGAGAVRASAESPESF